MSEFLETIFDFMKSKHHSISFLLIVAIINAIDVYYHTKSILYCIITFFTYAILLLVIIHIIMNTRGYYNIINIIVRSLIMTFIIFILSHYAMLLFIPTIMNDIKFYMYIICFVIILIVLFVKHNSSLLCRQKQRDLIHSKSLISFIVAICITLPLNTNLIKMATSIIIMIILWGIIDVFFFHNIYPIFIKPSKLFEENPRFRVSFTTSDNNIMLLFMSILVWIIFKLLYNVTNIRGKNGIVTSTDVNIISSYYFSLCICCVLISILLLTIFSRYCLKNRKDSMLYYRWTKLWIPPVITWTATIGVTLTALSTIKGVHIGSINYIFPLIFAYLATPLCILFSTSMTSNSYLISFQSNRRDLKFKLQMYLHYRYIRHQINTRDINLRKVVEESSNNQNNYNKIVLYRLEQRQMHSRIWRFIHPL